MLDGVSTSFESLPKGLHFKPVDGCEGFVYVTDSHGKPVDKGVIELINDTEEKRRERIYYEHQKLCRKQNQFEIVNNQGEIDWGLVDNDNIVAAVAGLAAHVMNKGYSTEQNTSSSKRNISFGDTIGGSGLGSRMQMI